MEVDGWMDGWMGNWTTGQMNGWIRWYMDKWIDGNTDAWMYGYIGRCPSLENSGSFSEQDYIDSIRWVCIDSINNWIDTQTSKQTTKQASKTHKHTNERTNEHKQTNENKQTYIYIQTNKQNKQTNISMGKSAFMSSLISFKLLVYFLSSIVCKSTL